MTRTIRWPLAWLIVVALVAGACRDSTPTVEESPPETANLTEPDRDAEEPDPDEPGPDGRDNATVDDPRIVPPLELPADAPGSDEAAEALIESLSELVPANQLAEGVPWPDFRNPDPVAVYQTDAAFQQWMSENNPTPSLVEAYTAPGSPEREFDLEMFGFLDDLDLRSGPASPAYSMRVEGLVHPAATGITDALLAAIPEGSAAVVYWDSVGASDTFTAEGQFWGTNEGWAELGPWVAIMAPTDVGWQVWWDELTEPPPPGSRENQGQPQEDDRRVDL